MSRMPVVPALFGNRRRTVILLAIYLLEEAHLREIARVTGSALFSVQRAIDSFEEAGIARSTMLGSERRVKLNPSFFAARELRGLLERMTLAFPEFEKSIQALRRRPRKRGKPL